MPRFLILALAALLLAGCSLPRAAELCHHGSNNTDNPPTAGKTSFDITPCPAESFPGVTVVYEVPLPADEAFAFVTRQLESRQWKPDAQEVKPSDSDATHRILQNTFEKWDYLVDVDIEGKRASPTAPETSHVVLHFESRHPWDQLPWIYPRYLTWRILHGPWLAWIF